MSSVNSNPRSSLRHFLMYPELRHVFERDVGLLSGGELQRFAIGTVCVQKADVVSDLCFGSSNSMLTQLVHVR